MCQLVVAFSLFQKLNSHSLFELIFAFDVREKTDFFSNTNSELNRNNTAQLCYSLANQSLSCIAICKSSIHLHIFKEQIIFSENICKFTLHFIINLNSNFCYIQILQKYTEIYYFKKNIKISTHYCQSKYRTLTTLIILEFNSSAISLPESKISPRKIANFHRQSTENFDRELVSKYCEIFPLNKRLLYSIQIVNFQGLNS